MMNASKPPIKLTLHGIDSRVTKGMTLFLRGPCMGAAYLVLNTADADADIFDGDSSSSMAELREFRQSYATKPVIVFSVRENPMENTIPVKKPAKAKDLLFALDQVGQMLEIDDQHAPVVKPVADFETGRREDIIALLRLMQRHPIEDETDIDSLPNLETPNFIAEASFDQNNYFFGHVLHALEIALAKSQNMKLKSGWWPVYFFPQSLEIAVESDDDTLKTAARNPPVTEVEGEELALIALGSSGDEATDPTLPQQPRQNLETFLWKLACWTSRGRYPDTLDIHLPVYLKNWPNFSRLPLTPHALRIAALLIRGPRTMLNIAKTLAINPQYVFVFISTCQAIGLSDQAKRTEDNFLSPPDLAPSGHRALYQQILARLT